jgi:deoxyribonuclease V
MHVPPVPHAWPRTTAAAIRLQTCLADRVVQTGELRKLHLVAGADLAFTEDGATCIAGVVVWDVRAQRVVERTDARRPVRFPYVPGLLTFREAPALLAAIRKLESEADVFLFDGQGYSHPRRFGLACHMGTLLGRPSIGCAKSRLIGTHDEPKWTFGASKPLLDDSEVIGRVLRTRADAKPVYVSIGHQISLDSACRVVLACCLGFRVPEPTRLADHWVRQLRRTA